LIRTLKNLKEKGLVRQVKVGERSRIVLTPHGKKLNDEALGRPSTFRIKNKLQANQLLAMYELLSIELRRSKWIKGHASMDAIPKSSLFRKARALVRYGLMNRDYTLTPFGELAVLRQGRSLVDPTKPVEKWSELNAENKKRYYLAVVAGLLQEMRMDKKKPNVRMPAKDFIDELNAEGRHAEALLHEEFGSLEARVYSESTYVPSNNAVDLMHGIATEMRHRLRTGRSLIE
jgi:DNA-binding HxlR family transcriptional regulator